MFLLPSTLSFGILILTLFTENDAVEPTEISKVRNYTLEFFEGGKGWEMSQKSCEERDSWLVEIEDEEIFNAVMQLKKHHIIWIGAYYLNGWAWNGSNPIRYDNWKSAYPSTVRTNFNNYCGLMQEGGSWINIDCKKRYRYICQSDINYPGSFNVSYERNDFKSFADAKVACESSDDSRLIEIRTSALNSLIEHAISGEQIQYWTSGNDKSTEGEWKWGDGSLINMYSKNWILTSAGGQEPNGGREENCLTASYRGWSDEVCNGAKGYICQKDVTNGICESEVCANEGRCEISGKRFRCACNAGYFGTKCENELLQISVTPEKIELHVGEELKVKIAIKSYEGNVIVTAYKKAITTWGPTTFTLQKPGNVVSMDGSFTNQQESATYTFRAIPEIGQKVYVRQSTVTVTVRGQCSLSPCKNEGTCRDTTTSPYYQCACKPEYSGTQCSDLKFIAYADANCRYYIHNDLLATFASANSTCSEQGSLAMIKTQQVQSLIENQVVAQYGSEGNMELWVGGYKIQGVWFWMDGTRIPLTGTYQKWRGSSNNYMILSSWGSTRDNMHWYSKNGAKRGYVCEKPVFNLCDSMNCQNGGTCISTGCQVICSCALGFDGDSCQNGRITMTPNSLRYIVVQGQSTVVKMNITSNDGPIKIELLKDDISIKVLRSVNTSFSITIGPFQNQTEGDKYTFRSTPESAPGSYYKYANVTIRVEGPPTVKISEDILALPTGTEITNISCEATGVPTPSISWRKGGMDVTTVRSATVSQFNYSGYSWLAFSSKAQTEVGYYTCYAENEVTEERRMGMATLFVRGKLKLVNRTERQSESSSEHSTFSCTYEGYPAPRLQWKFDSLNNSPLNKTWSIFQIQNVAEEGSALNRSTSTLTIRLPEYLGPVKLSCNARNDYENTTVGCFKLNGDSVLWRNTSYRIYTETNERKNFTDARAFCQHKNRFLIMITNAETQDMISNQMTYRKKEQNVQSSFFVGAQKKPQGNVTAWEWINDLSSNSAANSEGNAFYDRITNKSYTAWSEGEPNEPGNTCVMLYETNGWRWSDTKCNNTLGFICESQVAGIPKKYVIAVERCSANIIVTWMAGIEAIGVKHRIDVTETSSVSSPVVQRSIETIPADGNSLIQQFPHLKLEVMYNVTITVCPDCPLHFCITKTVSTYAIVPAFNLTVNAANLTRVGKTCVITWSFTSKGVIGFKVVSSSVLVYAASKKYLSIKNVSEYNTSHEVGQQVITTDPNRIYSFTVEVETCEGFGPPMSVYGECISKTSAPLMIPTPVVTQMPNNDGTMTIQIGIPDETNGPLSCIFVIIVYNPEPLRNNSWEKYSLDHLRKAMLKSTFHKLNTNDAYLTLAITRSTVRSDLEKEDFLIRNIGDETTAECDVAATLARKRRKRSTPVNKIVANNRRLEDGASYRLFTVTATPSDNEVFLQTSNMSVSFKPYLSNSAGMIAGIVISVAVVIFLVAAVLLWVVKKKKKRKQPPEAVNMQEVRDDQEGLYVNLAIDNREPRSVTDIPLDQLHNTYNSLKAKDNVIFQKQFQKLKEEALKLEYPTEMASNPTLQKKNRYKNILPSDHSRVILSGSGEATYINACFIHGFSSPRKFIAAQGPLSATVNDFWRMVVEQKCSVIAMLTKCKENLKVKCERYWPDHGLSKTFSEITVENSQEQNYGSYVVRNLHVNYGGKMKEVTHLHFLDWPDHGVPVATTNILRYYEAVMKCRSSTPIVVHCSAGAGRTGAFIAYDIVSEEAESLSLIDVYKCVLKMREQRVDMVQTCNQYIFVHKLLLEKYLFGNTEFNIDDISDALSSESTLRKEFENISAVGPINQTKFGDLPKNLNLNRDMDIIPYERNRVTILKREFDTEIPYINASTIETYARGTELVAAQGPMKTSIAHFWRAVFDNNVNTIVMLTKCMEGEKEQSAKYWPDEEGETLTLNDMKIYLQSLNETEQVIVRQFNVLREGEEKMVIQYQYVGWDSNTDPEKASDFLELVEKMHTSVRATTGGRTLIHCSDGAGRTGTFCAILNLLERLKFENKVDVFRAVKDLRDCRPGMVQTMEQYRFCYEALSIYLSSIHLYSNHQVKEQKTTENIYQNL